MAGKTNAISVAPKLRILERPALAGKLRSAGTSSNLQCNSWLPISDNKRVPTIINTPKRPIKKTN
jgi:hypothetical protein